MVEDLSKKYKCNKKKTNSIITKLNLVLDDVGFVVIKANKGAGKTTLLRLFDQSLTPTSGTIKHSSSNEKYDAIPKEDMVSIYLDDTFYDNLTIEQNLQLLNRQTFDDKKVHDLLKQLNFKINETDSKDFLTKNCSSLTKEERIKLLFIRALLADRNILIIDDLDQLLVDVSQDADTILSILKEYSSTKLILCTITSNDNIERQASTLLLLKDGELAEYRQSELQTDIENKLEKRPIFNKQLLSRIFLNMKTKLAIFFCVLSAFFLMLFSVGAYSLTITNIDINQSLINKSYSEQLEYVTINSRYEFAYHGNASKHIVSFGSFTDEQTKNIYEYSNSHAMRLTAKPVFSKYFYQFGETADMNSITILDALAMFSNKAVIIDADSAFLNDFQPYYKLNNKSNNRFPTSIDEIALSWIQAEFLIEYGLDGTTDKSIEIDDLIGQKIDGKTITGIYQNEDKKFFDKYFPPNERAAAMILRNYDKDYIEKGKDINMQSLLA